MDKKVFNWLLVVIWMVAIFLLSAIPSYPVDLTSQQYNLVSLIFHLVLYAILTWFFIRAFMSSGIPVKKSLAYGFLSAIIYGITDEFHQYFVPGRKAHLSDWLFDVVGAMIIFYFYKYKSRK